MKTVYISRHSKSFKDLFGEYNTNESEQITNEKNPLSIDGEKKAQKLSELAELQNIKTIYSSHYVRAMSTAKYIAINNNIKLNIDSRFGERKFGVENISDLPKDFFDNQIKDWNYKLPNGESLNDTHYRIKEALFELLNKEQPIMLVSHATSLTAMLKDWCDIKLNEETKLMEIYFNNKLIFDGAWKAPDLFKLTFENNNLINIEHIDITY